MKNIKKIVIATVVICVLFVVLQVVWGVTTKPYIKSDSVVYYTNEDNAITKLEITIVNPSFKTVTDSFFLRYEREDEYPEGYSSPVHFTISPYETLKLEIVNFRNTWYFNENYHIDVDKVENHNLNIQKHHDMYVTELICKTNLLVVYVIVLISIFCKKGNEVK